MNNAVLKIALVRGAGELEPWMGRLAERVCVTDGMELVGQVMRSDTSSKKRMNWVHRLWWSAERKMVAKPTERETPIFDDLETALPRLDLADATAIKKLDVDVIIDLTTGSGAGISPDAARFGVWFLKFLTPMKAAMSVWSIADNAPFFKAKLCRTMPDGQLPEMVSSAVLNLKMFASLNHLFTCEKAVSLIMRELKRLSVTNELAPGSKVHLAVAQRKPGVFTFTRYAFGVVRRVAKRFVEVQASKLHFRPGEFFLKTSKTDLLTADPANMNEHHSSANGYFADPFLWEHDGEMYCFFEVYNYAKDTGYIAAGKLVDGVLSDIMPAVKTDYHMSFPFLFEDEAGTLFMMPEVCSQKRIETWKCIEFPHRWERVQTVLDDVIAADSSLAKIDNDWWLFTNMSNDPFGEMSSELHLYKVDGPGLSKLTPHPLNPVVFDTRIARNGGRVIQKQSDYYRMSQDNSHGLYGYGVNAMKIEHISMKDYRETLERKIEPDFQPGIIGSHHMDSRAGMVVMDVRKRIGGFRLRSSEKPQKLSRGIHLE